MRIRGYRSGDLPALYAISLQTGHAGADASDLYADAQMMGHVYSAPYALLEPSLALVIEDGCSVEGFIFGSIDTRAWEDRLLRDWWPMLRRRYPDPDSSQRHTWTADQRRAFMIHHPTRTPASICERYQAHPHMNLLPSLQRRGIGPKLFGAWLEIVQGRRASALHVGVNSANAGATRFWHRQGFAPLPLSDLGEGRTLWMGRSQENPDVRNGTSETTL